MAETKKAPAKKEAAPAKKPAAPKKEVAPKKEAPKAVAKTPAKKPAAPKAAPKAPAKAATKPAPVKAAAAPKVTAPKAEAPKVEAPKVEVKKEAPAPKKEKVVAKAKGKQALPYVSNGEIRVELTGSTNGCTKKQIRTVQALGLKKINDVRIHKDNPAIRGMVRVVAHLVKVEKHNAN